MFLKCDNILDGLEIDWQGIPKYWRTNTKTFLTLFLS